MGFKYKAFISYRHVPRDSAAAKAIQQMLEQYIIPEDCVDGDQKKIGDIFRDDTDLDAHPDLQYRIFEALDASEYLIVICSNETQNPEKHWVMDEIDHFLSAHPKDKVLTVLVGDEPDKAIPEILWVLEKGSEKMTPPHYVDIRAKSLLQMHLKLRKELLTLCATLLSCRKDKLAMREEKRRSRRNLLLAATVAAVASVIIGILMWSNWQIEGKNAELEQKNEQLEQQNNEILLRESKLLTQEALEALAAGDTPSAVRNALAALPSAESDRPYYAPAEQTLWSALDPLHVDAYTAIPRKTVLEQASPVVDLCVSGDGRLLTTIDPYSVLTCFDTVTGEQIWTNKLVADMSHINIAIYPCPVWNSVIVIYYDTAYGISQETGEVLWTNGNAYYGDHFEMSDDGRYLVCMVETYSPYALSIAAISTENGATMNVYPVAESDYYYYEFDRDVYDFSADGTRFAGCYREQLSDESYELVFFVTDLSNSSTEIIYRQKATDPYEDVYKLSFTDGDTALTIARDSNNSDIAAIVEKVSIPDKSLLWRTTTPTEEPGVLLYSYFEEYHLADCSNYLLLGIKQSLYALDPATGEILGSKLLNSDLLTLEAGAGGEFVLVLADGSYHCGWINSYGLHTMDNEYLSFSFLPTDLGAMQGADLWNGGYMYVQLKDSLITYYGSEDKGFGYAISIPQDSDRTVIITRIAPFSVDLDSKTLVTTDVSEEIDSYGINVCSDTTLSVQCSAETVEGSERHRFFLLDRATLEVTDSFAVDLGLNSYHNTFVLPDGSGLIYQDSGSELCFFDRKTQTSTVLVPDFNVDIPFLIDGKEIKTDRLKTKSFRSSADHSVWTILTTDHGIKYWINGQAQPDVPWPDIWGWLGSVNMYDADFHLGCGSYILVDPPPYSETAEYNNYSFYSTDEEKWYQIPCGENDLTHHITCMGETSSVFTVMDHKGLIRSYDIPTGKQTMEITTGLSSNSVAQLKWILNDRYLTIFTEDKLLCIIDGTTAETVYQQSMADYYFWDPPSFAADPKGERLYIWETEGLCVDTRSWSTLFDIPDIDLYDPVSDRILYIDSILEEDSYIDTLQSYRLPTTEELVEMGRQFLGE